MKIGFYTGSFDPFTNGHLQIVRKAAELFDKVIIGIGIHPTKRRRYDKEEMKSAIKEVLQRENINNVDEINKMMNETYEEVEIKNYFEICIDKDGYYTTGEGSLVEVKTMPNINNVNELPLYKYNAETKSLVLDEIKAAEIRKEAFKVIIDTKIKELSAKCKEAIETGIDYNEEHFSYTLADQNNISNSCQLAMTTGLSVPYHADGKDCRLYTKEEIVAIYCSQEMNVTHHTTYFNQLKQYISTLTTEEEVKLVEYGQELTGVYLETYNEIMEQASVIATAFASNNQIS
jgi:cytidyltransferase-like protein